MSTGLAPTSLNTLLGTSKQLVELGSSGHTLKSVVRVELVRIISHLTSLVVRLVPILNI